MNGNPDPHPTTTVPILPLKNSVMFPASVVPINVGRTRSVRIIERAVRSEDQVIGVVSQRKPEVEEPNWTDLYRLGTAARILKAVKLEDGNYSVVLQGIGRIRIVQEMAEQPFLMARVEHIAEPDKADLEVEALATNLKETARQLIALLPNLPKEAAAVLDHVSDPGVLADLVASNLTVSVEEKQMIIEAVDFGTRLRTCLQLLTRQIEMLKVKKEISSMVQEEMGRNQREYFLRQQLKAIKEELGEGDEEEDEVEELKERITDAGMASEAEKMAFKQLGRLKHMQSSSAEYTVTRTYLDWLLDIPWQKATDDKLDVDKVKEVLDEDHYDLEKVKRRILEQIAVLKLKPDKKGPILCLVGPPGVGKTSLGRSIARALTREFVRVSLGGVRDEAEIRGHRRTYVGALPGRVIQGMKRAGSVNPLFMLDELDKLGHDFRGDPSSALLEVLDPEQNHAFSDHYLEVPYDLSKVMFVGTANTLSTIPPALLDRMEVIEIPGYTREEKRKIAYGFIIPKQLREHGLDEQRLKFNNDGLLRIVDSYTREAGVRNLEREVAAVCRSVAVKVARGEQVDGYDAGAAFVEEILGPPRFFPETADRCEVPGVATGLAWTPSGGDIIFIEATRMKGSGKVSMTGQLGDVMKESVQTAVSFVRANAEHLGLDPEFNDHLDLHLHVPAGGIPKDGPSAGVAMLTALVSLLSGRKVRPNVAMTGEITLRGLVLPIGGVKEKVLAAHRAGITTVVMPERNQKDRPDIPKEILDEIALVFVRRMDEVLEAALEPAPAQSPA
ncbi:MAG: endopeptidase La [Deltaproteobacteria bacterium]|nr:endopeptidase La [Deltaproteobacteria bacterium]